MAVVATLADLRVWMGLGVDTTLDAQLQTVLEGVDAAFAEFMRRTLLLQRQTEVVPRTRAFQRTISLRHAPVSTVISVHADPTRTWAASTLVPVTEYSLQSDAGLLSFDGYELPDGRNLVRVVYDGGMASDAADFKARHPDLHQAALVQAQHEYQRRKTPGTTTEIAQGANKVFTGPLALLPYAVERLTPYRRLRLGG